PTEFRLKRWPAITAESQLTRPGQTMIRLGLRVDPVNRVALAQCKIQIAIRGAHDGTRSDHRRSHHRCAFRSPLRLTRSGIRLDDSRIQMQPADAMVPDVADQHGAVAIEHDAVRLIELCPYARTAVAPE